MTNAKSTLTENAAEHWRELARIERVKIKQARLLGSTAVLERRAALYESAAKAIDLSRETGMAHCACHLIPTDACREMKR